MTYQETELHPRPQDLPGPRPAWVTELGRYGRAAFEWHRRWPVIQPLTQSQYQELHDKVEAQVQEMMETWEEFDVENRHWTFGLSETISDHPLELRMLLETGVCRELVYQPQPPAQNFPFPWYSVGWEVWEMLQPNPNTTTFGDIQDLEIWVQEWVQTMEEQEMLEADGELEDGYFVPNLDACMPTMREILVDLMAKKGYKLDLYQQDRSYKVERLDK